MQRLTVTHVTRWQKHHNQFGCGHVYQVRFKSFPVENGEYVYQVNRYVERNTLRANLVDAAEHLAVRQSLDYQAWNARAS